MLTLMTLVGVFTMCCAILRTLITIDVPTNKEILLLFGCLIPGANLVVMIYFMVTLLDADFNVGD